MEAHAGASIVHNWNITKEEYDHTTLDSSVTLYIGLGNNQQLDPTMEPTPVTNKVLQTPPSYDRHLSKILTIHSHSLNFHIHGDDLESKSIVQF
ncbi:unnamed protein product [Sphenostylis stenocarpa]|uniref:Uncharacterized protein n=1 Tax=Sphenostylis stenocarpa TaxID=92480 RepID=A0AA86SYK4_9FABA|nr:unnamed protein product [Sphenostylis stenocarpa]